MKKKRFIKLLMSYGMPRNDARKVAEWVWWDNEHTSRLNQILKHGRFKERMAYLSFAEYFERVLPVISGGTV